LFALFITIIHAGRWFSRNFEQSIISEHQSIEEARCIEQWWLDYYHTYNKRWNELYNTAKYVYMPMSGRKHTTDAIKKISEASKRMHSDPEFKEKHRKALKNAMSKPETKKKLSDIGKIVQNRDDVNIKRSTSLKKAYSSEEVRKNHGKIIKEALAKPEAKEHQQAAMKKMWNSEEFRKKMNKTNNSIETKTRRSNAAKEVNKRPEYKEKQRNIQNFLNNLSHYTDQRNNQLSIYIKDLETYTNKLKTIHDPLKKDVKMLKKYVGYKYRIKVFFFLFHHPLA